MISSTTSSTISSQDREGHFASPPLIRVEMQSCSGSFFRLFFLAHCIIVDTHTRHSVLDSFQLVGIWNRCNFIYVRWISSLSNTWELTIPPFKFVSLTLRCNRATIALTLDMASCDVLKSRLLITYWWLYFSIMLCSGLKMLSQSAASGLPANHFQADPIQLIERFFSVFAHKSV